MAGMSIVGKGVARVDALEKVTGHAKYVMDLKLPNILYCKVKRSRLPHAKIINIDVSKAERLTGVKATVTAADTPNIRIGLYVKDETIFAYKKVRYIGEAIAAVAAIDEDIAEEAVELIEVEYEELPALFDPLEAVSAGSPLIHEDIGGYLAVFDCVKYGNVCSHTTIEQGNVKKGFDEADFVFEDTFKTKTQHQCTLEPQPAIADVDASGKITLWSAGMDPFTVRGYLAGCLEIPMSKIRLRTMHIGGSFGGKETYIPLGICLLLSRKTGQPVKLELTRKEEFMVTTPRHPSLINIKTGVAKDGTLVAREANIVMDNGAYANSGPGVLSYAAASIKGPYNIPHVKVDARLVYTNKQPFGAFRGYGNPQSHFAAESQIDIIANKLGIDPIEIRLKNCFEKEGSELSTGQKVYNCGLKETIERASSYVSSKISAEIGNEKRRIGRGVACMLIPTGLLGAGASIKVNEDGTFVLLTGAPDVGQGSSTVLSQIAAEELGVILEDISIITADTDTTPLDYGAIGSRVTHTTGNAVRLAAIDVKKRLFELASEMLEVDVKDLEFHNKKVGIKGSPDRNISIGDLSQAGLFQRGSLITGQASFLEKSGPLIAKRVQGYPVMEGDPAFQSATVTAEVEVDTETGRVNVLSCVLSQDVGRCINPITLEGQMQGATIQGIGYALTEDAVYSDGLHLNPNFVDYKILTALDVPEIVPLVVEEPDPTGPYGAKGVGEGSLVPQAPAIANAIYDAVGVRIKELPITAEKIRRALKEKGLNR